MTGSLFQVPFERPAKSEIEPATPGYNASPALIKSHIWKHVNVCDTYSSHHCREARLDAHDLVESR